jgi:hypothetical protein
MTNGALQLNGNITYTVSSQPFQIWRGRGFGINEGLYGTNAVAVNVTNVFRFASVHKIPGTTTLVTNWANNANLTWLAPISASTEQFDWTNVPASVDDNITLGQLLSLTVGSGTNAIWFDPTNSFIGTYP